MNQIDEEITVFQERLITLRKKAHLSQEAFAKAIGASRSAVRDWELGDKMPGGKMLLRIAQFHGVSVDYLLGRTSRIDIPAGELPTEVAMKFYELIRSVEKMQMDLMNGVTQI